MLNIQKKPFSPPQALEYLHQCYRQSGAVVSFSGFVRDHVQNLETSTSVSALEIDAYGQFTYDSIFTIMQKAYEKWPDTHAHIIHRYGYIKAQEAIVFVGVASAHRRNAFLCAQFLMDYLKTDAPFWKKEIRHTIKGREECWIEPTKFDIQARQDWDKQNP